jgi:hypothetical protein
MSDDNRLLLSRYMDGELTPSETEEVESLLARSPEARRYLESLQALRRRIRYELAEPGPDVTGRVLEAIDGVGHARPIRSRLLPAFAAGLAAGVLFVGLALERPSTVAAADIPSRVFEAQSSVVALDAQIIIVERGWHPEVPERNFRGRLSYRAPESLVVVIEDQTTYPSTDWQPNDSTRVVAESMSWESAIQGCPTSGLPDCLVEEPRVQLVEGREPFPDSLPAPLDLIVPVRSFAGAAEPDPIGLEVVNGRQAVGVEVSVAQAQALLDGLTGAGNWRDFHPTDVVQLWLDSEFLFPVSLRVYPAANEDRMLWAARNGYDDAVSVPILEVDWSEITTTGSSTPTLPDQPPGLVGIDAGFEESAFSNAVLLGIEVPEGMTIHRTGTLESGGPTVSITSWSDGRAWLKVSSTTTWPGGRLFGDVGVPARQVGLSEGVAYLSERGDRIGLHSDALDLIVTGSVGTQTLIEVADSLDIVGLEIPGGWAEASVVTLDEARELVPLLLQPVGLLGFGPPSVRAHLGSVEFAYAGPGNRGFTLIQAVEDSLAPPLEADVTGVEVRGLNARYSPGRGVLEWVEGELVVTLQSETLALDELVIIADSLAMP